MSREIRYYASYTCPHCQVQLEARTSDWDGWLRCPECKQLSLPPDPLIDPREPRQNDILRHADNAIVFLPESPEAAMQPDFVSPASPGRFLHTSPARLIFTTGFALSLFLVLVAFLDNRTGNMTIFGLLTIGFFVLLVRSPRNRMAS